MSCTPRSVVPSPCINVCRMDQRSGLCEGCLRTLDEIAAWGQASEAQRLDILARIVGRREAEMARIAAIDGSSG